MVGIFSQRIHNRLSFCGTIVFIFCFLLGARYAEAAPIKILSNSSHAAGNISGTITQLLGRAFTSDEFVIHMTSTDSTYAGSSANAALASTTRYTLSGVATTSQAPYNIYTSSFTGYPGESVSEYNISVSNDVVNNYAYSAPTLPPLTPPPAFFVTPGITSYSSGGGIEWRLDEAIFCSTSLSCLTASNAGMMAVLRWLHSTSTNPWNWFDVKAALRQTGANWATGYNHNTYGFGQVNYTTANALTSNQIFLQPPSVATSTSGISSQITFTVYPFRQTRRVKDALYQFSSAPTFQANEMSSTTIAALGGTKVTEYTGVAATTTAPIYATTTNAYFVWFTEDNADDALANFSRIDTYTILGPLSQSRIDFTTAFDTATPSNNAISTTQAPTFSWGAADSHFGISKYQLYVDGVLNKDNIVGTSATPTGNLGVGTHTWYVKAFNTTGAATTTTSTPIINIIPGYASGFTFYVDNVLGSDSNPGTQALPWATIAKAANTAQTGDTVVIIKNAGVPYRETLTPLQSGSAGYPVTFRGVDASHKPEIWGSVDVSSGWSVYNGGNPSTYQLSFATTTSVVAAGPSILTLSKKVKGASAATLNPGEWFSSGGVLYYRLATGENIGSLHIEAASADYGISDYTANYNTFQDLIVRYANIDGVYISNAYQNITRVEVYDSYEGIQIDGANDVLQYAVAAHNNTNGVNMLYPRGSNAYNVISYGNGTKGVVFSGYTGISMALRNIISFGNSGSSFGSQYLWGSPSITASHNLWGTAGDSAWTNTYKGTNNQELVDPLLVDATNDNFALKPLSPGIDAGTTTNAGATTDILGNPIYGTPDLGPYEYQPPYTIGTDDIDITGSVRLYGNGKYRYTTATSTGVTAHMNIAPIGGFPASDRREFLNVSISKWHTSGDYAKTWTESSSIATSTVHTISGFKANTYYNVTVDGTQYASVLTDGTGQGAFTYTGGYSTHTFDVSEDTGAPAIATPAVINARIGGGATQTFTWAAATDPSGVAKYQLFVDGALKEDNITGTQTTASGFSCGDHTWYINAIDSAGNIASSAAQSFAVVCGGGVYTGPASSLPGYVAPRPQTITPDGKVTYLDTPRSTSAPQQATPVSVAHPIIAKSLKKGSIGIEVTALQEFLRQDRALYPEGLVTGYFGPATERAVKRFQKKYDIISSGTPQTTGYGMVGPRTRIKLNEQR